MKIQQTHTHKINMTKIKQNFIENHITKRNKQSNGKTKLTPHPHQKSRSHPSKDQKHIQYYNHLLIQKKTNTKIQKLNPYQSNNELYNSQTSH